MTGSRRFGGVAALVTGAGQGIGRACVGRLAAEGARVAVTDLDLDLARSVADDLPGSAGRVALHMDVTDRVSVDGAVAAAADELGGLSPGKFHAADLAADALHRALGVAARATAAVPARSP